MLRLSSNSSQQYLETLSALGHPSCNADGWTAAQLPRKMGAGWMKHLELQRGFEVAMFEYQFRERALLEVNIDEPGFNFACVLGGDLPWDFVDDRRHSEGNGAVLWMGMGTEQFRTRSCQPVHCVSVTASAEFLRQKWRALGAPMSGTLESLLNRPQTRSSITRRPLATTTIDAARRLLGLGPRDAASRLRIESLALAILCDHIEALSETPENRRFKPVRGAEIEKLHEVRRILAEHPERSPSLGELARSVGTNECSLKSGFPPDLWHHRLRISPRAENVARGSSPHRRAATGRGRSVPCGV